MQKPDLFSLSFLWLLLLTTTQVVYEHAIFGRDGIHDVVLVKKVERRKIDFLNQLMKMVIRSNTFQIN